MEVRDSSSANGAQVDQFRARPTPTSSGVRPRPRQQLVHAAVSMNSGKCLDVSGNSTANGAKVQQWACNGSTAQSFTFN